MSNVANNGGTGGDLRLKLAGIIFKYDREIKK